MASLGLALAVVLGVNVMLFLGQVAVLELNPEGPVYYNCADSLIGSFEAQNCQGTTYVLNDDDPGSALPSGGSQISIGSGNIFTDTFSAISGWFADTTGISYLYNIVAAPYNFLKAIGMPVEASFALGAMWYGFSFIIIASYFFGRDY